MNRMSQTDCCLPSLGEPLDAEAATELAAMFKVLADPIRIRIVSLIASSPTGEICTCDLPEALDRSQPTISHHLSLLSDAGIVEREQRGKWAWFRLATPRLAALRTALAGCC